MKNDSKATYLTRDAVLKLLSDEETARVSSAEAAPALVDGDEYVDLKHLEKGVRRAGSAPVHMGEVLPRKSVGDATWSAIVARLAPRPGEASALHRP